MRIRKKTIQFTIIFVIAVAGALMFHVEENENMDFIRYQDVLNSIRSSKISFIDYMIYSNNVTKWTNALLPYAYGFKALLYLVARCFKNDYVLTWISIIIDYGILIIISNDWKKGKDLNIRELTILVLTCFSLLPYIQACSGLRTATSACFMALGVYYYLYRGKNTVWFVAVSIIAISFHPFPLLAIPIAIMIRFFNKKATFFVTLTVCLLIPVFIQILSFSSNPFLREIANKYRTYTAGDQFRAYRFCLYGVLVYSTILILSYIFFYRRRGRIETAKTHAGRADKLYLFLACYSGMILTNLSSYEIVVRNGYLLGALSPGIIGLVFENNTDDARIVFLLRMIISVLMLYMSLSYIHYYAAFFLP